MMRWLIGALFGLLANAAVHAITPEDAMALVDGGSDERIATLNRLAAQPDEKAAALIRALADEAVRIQGERVVIVEGETGRDAVTGEALALDEYAEEPMLNNRLRGALDFALAGMELAGGDAQRQREAALILQRGSFDEPDAEQLPVIEQALAGELDDEARQTLELAQAAVLLASEDVAQRL
ncbi:MAG TPA: urea ABC transporter permease subunit UrtB, partial [Hydrogenophaga sp.]